MTNQSLSLSEEVRYAVIVAGGCGARMRSAVPKQFLPLQNSLPGSSADSKPLSIITQTLLRFASCVQEIVLVLPQDQISTWEAIRVLECPELPSPTIVIGGDTRFASVSAGLSVVPDGVLVAIHDGVRPFVSAETIERAFHAASEHGASVPVIPLTDSIRKLASDGLSEAVPRTDYVAVQTPQAFRSEKIKKAYSVGYQPAFTDDASVYEAYYHECVALVPGNAENIKITTAIDLCRTQQPS